LAELLNVNRLDNSLVLGNRFIFFRARSDSFHAEPRQCIAKWFQPLAPLLGTAAAGTLFAVALLASGQSATIVGTLAGQVVMEGFMHWKITPWLRRLITRSLAIIPTAKKPPKTLAWQKDISESWSTDEMDYASNANLSVNDESSSANEKTAL
jgi:hypothetical protein